MNEVSCVFHAQKQTNVNKKATAINNKTFALHRSNTTLDQPTHTLHTKTKAQGNQQTKTTDCWPQRVKGC